MDFHQALSTQKPLTALCLLMVFAECIQWVSKVFSIATSGFCFLPSANTELFPQRDITLQITLIRAIEHDTDASYLRNIMWIPKPGTVLMERWLLQSCAITATWLGIGLCTLCEPVLEWEGDQRPCTPMLNLHTVNGACGQVWIFTWLCNSQELMLFWLLLLQPDLFETPWNKVFCFFLVPFPYLQFSRVLDISL